MHIVILLDIGCLLLAGLLLWLGYHFTGFIRQQYHVRATSSRGRIFQTLFLGVLWGVELLVGGWFGWFGLTVLKATPVTTTSTEWIISIAAIALAFLIYWHLAHSWRSWQQADQ